MSCRELSDLLYPFVDGELSVEQNVCLLKHLELCPSCAGRVARERELRGLVERAAKEPAGTDVMALMGAALDRAVQEEAEPEELGAAPRAALVRWLSLAAALLITLGVGAGLAFGNPFCVKGCPTMRLANAAAQAADTTPTLTLAELRQSFPRPLHVPAACGIKVEGGQLVEASGAPPRPLLRLRCGKTGQCAVLLHVPEGHGHFWQQRELPDGRVYLEAHTPDGRHLVGWRAKGGVFVCVAQEEVKSGALFAMAAAVRDSFAG